MFVMTDATKDVYEEFDPEFRPQDDLFRHVNGIWLKEFEIEPDKSNEGSFNQLRDASELAVREILEESAANPKPGASQKIGDLFSAFLDEARANELAMAPVAADLNLIDSVTSIDDVTHLLGEFERNGISGLFGGYVDNDPGNPERYIFHLFHGGLGLPDEEYYRDPKHAEIRDAYIPFISQLFGFAGLPAAEADAAAQKLMSFETQLATHHWNTVDSRDAEKTYNLCSFSHLKSLTPTFDWDLWLKGAGLDAKVLEETVVMMPSFFEGLASVYNQDNLEAIKLWLKTKVVNSMGAYLHDELVNARFDFYGKKLSGTPEIRARWKRAVGVVEESLGEAIGEVYVEKHYPREAKAKMDVLVNWLIEAYRESITNLEWMSPETKVKALVKLDKFDTQIGYPKKWRDYSDLQIDRHDLVGNVRRVSEYVLKRELSKIGKPIDRDEWFMTPQTVNAYYNPGFNQIVFPAAILQHPFFQLGADDAQNFGAIGAVIGHEIGHGFDDQGSKYDGDGKLESWWTDADRAAFEARTKKLIDQYNELSPKQLDDEHKVNGAFTIGENIGDLGGVGIAYRAYLMSLGNNEAPVIDGFTASQRFFLSYARAWRYKSRDALAIQRLTTDPHSPAEFRVNQIVRNVDAFYSAFDVKPTDELWLDPADRVVIW
jgi:putative endopeptidase